MDDNDNAQWLCDRCGTPVHETAAHCHECGALFDQHLSCSCHHSREALGVCIICSQPWCTLCGGWIDERFLCARHAGYEIIENLARVYGDTDFVRLQFAQKCLEQAGLRPFQFSLRQEPAHGVGFGYPNLAHRGGDPHAVYEWKIMLPFDEVLRGEEVLRELDFIGETRT